MRRAKPTRELNAFGARLLFQFRDESGGRERRRRICEVRHIVVNASSARAALKKSNSYGKSSGFIDRRTDRTVHFEFVGVTELIDLIDFVKAEEPLEVWWEFREMIRPMERREKLIPPEDALRALAPIIQGRGRIKF